MSRTTLKSLASLAFVGALAAPLATAQDPTPPASVQAAQEPELFTIEELDNLLARVALYPDPILAQLLAAATFPDQVALAARYVRTYGQEGIDRQAWDVSVKSIAHYPPVLNLLDEDPDWTTALGQAYAIQEGDVMASVQGLRRMAHAQGNLVSTDEQKVEVEPEYIRIVPAQPRVIYVPTYDPEIIYYRPVHYHHVHSPYWTFGIGFPIGVWLTYDFDWGHRVVYYHGWDGFGRHHTWYHDSRPFIYINTVYVAPWRTVVVINRRVVHRYVDYRRFGRYNGVHRRVAWDRNGLPGRYDRVRDDDGRGRGVYASRRVADADRTRGSDTPAQRPVTGVSRSAQPRGEANRVRPLPTRHEPEREVARSTTPSRQPSGNGTWNARPTTERRAAPDRTSSSQRTNVSRGTTAPRVTPQVERRPVTSSRPVTVDRTPRSAPRATTARSAPERASAPSRQSAPRAAAPSRAPSRASAPSRSAPSRGSSAPKSEGRSVKRGS